MRAPRVVFAVAVALPFVGLLAFGLTRDPNVIDSPLIGSPAADFVLPVLEMDAMTRSGSPEPADSARLSAHRGEVVVLNFWASWCLACREEHAALSGVASEYRGRGVRFYGILYQDTPDNARRWIRAMGGQSYPSLLDPGSRTAIDYGVFGVPETFFIGRDGRIAYKQIGPVTYEILRTGIDSLVARPVESRATPVTKADSAAQATVSRAMKKPSRR